MHKEARDNLAPYLSTENRVRINLKYQMNYMPQAEQAIAKTALKSSPEAEGHFSPEDFLLGILRRAIADGQDIQIALPGVGTVVVFPKRGEYFSSLIDLAPLCRAAAAQVQVTPVAGGSAEGAEPKIGRNIDELLWQAGFYASEGRLMQGCFYDDVVQLHHWPNLSRLPITPNSMRICALLVRRPTSVKLAYHMLKVPAVEMFQFYTAARCAGIVNVLNREVEEEESHGPEFEAPEGEAPVLKLQRKQTLLSLLLERITKL